MQKELQNNGKINEFFDPAFFSKNRMRLQAFFDLVFTIAFTLIMALAMAIALALLLPPTLAPVMAIAS